MKSTIIVLLIAFWINQANAELYKWVDENGVTHFSNTLPPANSEVETKAEAKSNHSIQTSSGNLNEVLNSYRNDAISDDINNAKRKLSNKSSYKNNHRSKERNSRKIKDLQREVDYYKQKLRDVERESYSDLNEHQENIRFYKKMVADYQSLLESAKSR